MYQERDFLLDSAVLSYSSGKGVPNQAWLTASSKFEHGSQERLEFSVTGTTDQVSPAGSSKSARTYHFRAVSPQDYSSWSTAFEAHIACAVAKRAAESAQNEASDSLRRSSVSVVVPPMQTPKSVLSGILMKKSPHFPYQWQRREVKLVGGQSLMYDAGTGSEKGISLHEVRTIRMTDPAACEFEIVTRLDKRFLFRAPDRSQY